MTSRSVLVVGAGAMGRTHASAIAHAGDIVTGVVDTDPARAAALAPDAAAFPDVFAALAATEVFDAAVIATPSAMHLDQAAALLSAGVRTLVEKPHRIPGQDPAPLFDAETTGDARLFVGMSTRHWPGMGELTRAIQSGALGQIIHYRDHVAFSLPDGALPAWYFDDRVSGGGVLITNGIHAVDRVRALLGPLTVEEAILRVGLPGHRTEDIAVLRGHAAGAAVHVELAWTSYSPLATGLTITGTEGVAHLGMDGSWLVRTSAAERSGPAIDLDTVPFRRQWSAFCAGAAGFTIDDLEPSLNLIESVYEGDRRA